MDFRYHQIVNIYSDPNAYCIDKGWMTVDRPTQRRPDGNIESMMKDENWYELVVGDKSRSGGQWDIWEADVLARRRRRLSEADLGQVDRADRQAVAADWRKYDLRHDPRDQLGDARPEGRPQNQCLRRRRRHVLPEHAVEKLNEFLMKADNPKFTGEIVFQRRAPHCWGPRGADLMTKMIAHMEKLAPAGADMRSWRY